MCSSYRYASVHRAGTPVFRQGYTGTGCRAERSGLSSVVIDVVRSVPTRSVPIWIERTEVFRTGIEYCSNTGILSRVCPSRGVQLSEAPFAVVSVELSVQKRPVSVLLVVRLGAYLPNTPCKDQLRVCTYSL